MVTEFNIDLLTLCQAGIGFITHRDKSKQFHRMAADKLGIKLHALSRNNNDDGISSSCDGVSSSNSDDTTMVYSLFDLVDTSTFCKKLLSFWCLIT